MKKVAVCFAAALLLPLAGCKNESPKGGPGAGSNRNSGVAASTHTSGYASVPDSTTNHNPANSNKSNNTANTNLDADTFTLKVPFGNTDIDRGKSKEVAISIHRGDTFHQNVKLSFKLPEGIKVTPIDPVLKPGENEVKVTFQVDASATPGEKTIEVTGTPDTGKPTSVPITIKVEKRD